MASRNAELRRSSPLPSRPLGLGERLTLAVEIVAAYIRARRALRGTPIASVLATLRAEPAAQRAESDTNTTEEARRLGRAVARTLRFLPGDTRCLARSLVLTRLLARRGIPTKLVIATRSDPSFLAHAWVEHDGKPVLSPGDGSFLPLVEL
jgi:hypothetical protein